MSCGDAVLRRVVQSIAIVGWLTSAIACNLGDLPDLKSSPDTSQTVAEEIQAPDQSSDKLEGFGISKVVPALGGLAGLELVEIIGGGFRDGDRVFFGNSEAVDVIVNSANRLFITTPPHPAGRVDVRVVDPNGSEVVLEKGYLYFDPVVVHSVNPEHGPVTGGIPIEISGSGLTSANNVLVGGRLALNLTVVDDQTLLATLPAGVSGTADVHVITGTDIGYLPHGFVYFEPPHVTGIAPLAGPPTGGGTISLTGTGMIDGSSVVIGGTEAPVLALSADGKKLVARVPPGSVGRAEITVTTPFGQLTIPNGYSYVLPDNNVVLVNVWPAQGPPGGGGEVALVVTGLSDTDIDVSFGGTKAEILSVSAGQSRVLCRVPPGNEATAVDVIFTQDNTTSALESGYQYVKSVAVSTIDPGSGHMNGGTDVVIRGTGFSGSVVDVFVGALPAKQVVVADDARIEVKVPPGSPGLADVRVIVDGAEGQLTSGFTYYAGKTQVFVASPGIGSIAGNTYVQLHGTDLPAHMNIKFGEQASTWVSRLSPSTVACRTPRAEEPGAVDIQVTGPPGLELELPAGFVYYDPRARWGGTWGGPVNGSVNVTVLASITNEPVEGAVVVLGHDVPPQYKGYTDDRGQVTLSGPWLTGRQEVTATKAGLSAASIIDFDAANATLFLSGGEQGSGNGDGVPLTPGSIKGNVSGMGKYVKHEPTKCSELNTKEEGICNPCQSHADCKKPAAYCISLSNQPSFCSSACDSSKDCPGENFECRSPAQGEPKRCVPQFGDRQVRCFVSNQGLFQPQGPSTVDNTIELDSDDPGAGPAKTSFLLTNLRLGELAVYCMGGLRKVIDGVATFKPQVLGIERHVFVPPGALDNNGNPTDENAVTVEIVLDMPLKRRVALMVDEAPLKITGPHRLEARAWIVLGSDGVVPLEIVDLQHDQETLHYDTLPMSMSGELYDANYAFYAGALTKSASELPSSEVLRAKIGRLEDGPYLELEGTQFEPRVSGYTGDVLALHAASPTSVFGVTSQGSVIHYNGNSWWPQGLPNGAPLHGITDDGKGGLIVVGDNGRIARWDKTQWSTDVSPSSANLRDVAAPGALHAIAVGEYAILEYVDSGWTEIKSGPPKDLRAVWAQGVGPAWAVGSHGAVLRRDPFSGNWKALTVPFHNHLNSVWGNATGQVVAVGARGGVLMGDEQGLVLVETPTMRTLHDVWGRQANDVYAVGDGATVLHYNGDVWSTVSSQSINSSLRAITGSSPGGELVMAMGANVVQLGPFVDVPEFSSPAFGKIWNRTDVNWKVNGGASPSFAALRIYGPMGNLAWTITSAGWLNEYKLPDMQLIEGLQVVPPGMKRLFAYRIDHPTFSIDNYDQRAYRILDWEAWSIVHFLFDNPDSNGAQTEGGM